MSKISISNLAWDTTDNLEILSLIKGLASLELAPTKLWPNWEGATTQAARRLRLEYADMGVAVVAFQSILFQKQVNLFDPNAAGHQVLVDHIYRVAEMADELGARVLVFGAPRQRDRGILSADEAEELALERFAKIGDKIRSMHCVIGIEPNAPEYGCNFLTNGFDALSFVRRLDHRSIRLHLDAGCMQLVKDDPRTIIEQAAPYICHFHVSEPMLNPVDRMSLMKQSHNQCAQALHDVKYDGFVSIEMKPGAMRPNDVINSIKAVKTVYDLEQKS